ncbi:DinB superfamily protein [Algoriphagus boritolerans DSM 17298 = JCM 18970]|uniref:DinB superfamily protein n=2 Tax=Algoriphagus TaxID=246875 RepID=A0A1H5TJM5_9BACT|nr:DinB superfamily protein [Algoriphagus boritolerans DSM 17298 = JCM 18970]
MLNAKFIPKEFNPTKFYMNTFSLPKKGDYPVFYETYISKIPDENYSGQILRQVNALKEFFISKDAVWESLPYEEGKWSPKEVLGHLLDTERIMTFRALCFSRGEKNSLPGFDQDPYVISGKFNSVSTELLLRDFEAQRNALLTLINTLDESVLDQVGNANGNPITPRALFWIISGHFIHHFEILKERY